MKTKETKKQEYNWQQNNSSTNQKLNHRFDLQHQPSSNVVLQQKAIEELGGSKEEAMAPVQQMLEHSPHVQQTAQLQSVFSNNNNSGEAVLQKKENNTGLPDNLKSGIESLSGYSMDDVKVHYNSSKPVQLNAYAYTKGTDIHVASGQEKHVPHEAWHVVQQKQGRVQAITQLKGIGINNDARLEKEADVMGAKATSVHHVSSVKNTEKTNAKDYSKQEVVQRVGRPGVGIELETSSLKLKYTDKDHFRYKGARGKKFKLPTKVNPLFGNVKSNSSNEKDDLYANEENQIEVPENLKAPNLKGKDLRPNLNLKKEPSKDWSFTAETTGYKNIALHKELIIEIIVHGPDKKGVKLNFYEDNQLEEIGKDIISFLSYWTNMGGKTIHFNGVDWLIENAKDMSTVPWAVQITAPVPLGVFNDIISGNLNEEGPTQTLIGNKKNQERMLKVSKEHLPDWIEDEYITSELLGLLSFISSYVKAGSTNQGSGPEGIKKWLPVMPRTNFAKMYKMVNKGNYFSKRWTELVIHVCKSLNIKSPEKAAFPWGSSHVLTFKEWIDGIPKGTDLMAEYDRMYRLKQIGGLGEHTEHGLTSDKDEYPIFEFRDLDSIPTKDIVKKFQMVEYEIRKLMGQTSPSKNWKGRGSGLGFLVDIGLGKH